MLTVVLVFLSAGLGGVCRYLLGGVVQQAAGPSFPVGTLLVNALGCLAMGVVAAWLAGPVQIREEWRLAITAGFLGGFTTFSAFGRETLALVHDGRVAAACGYVLASNVLALGCVFAGWAAGSRVLGP